MPVCVKGAWYYFFKKEVLHSHKKKGAPRGAPSHYTNGVVYGFSVLVEVSVIWLIVR
jgi:hypothetical protein